MPNIWTKPVAMRSAAVAFCQIIPIIVPKCADSCIGFSTRPWKKGARFFVEEKIYKRMRRPSEGGGSPDSTLLRAARGNLKIHLNYIAYLAERRKWLAGENFSYADLAAGAMLSTIDYLGEVPWEKEPIVKDWYQRIKSRPAFRPILADSLKGIPPSSQYMDLDF